MSYPNCRLTREELHAHLQESGFGREEGMFECYFFRKERRDAEGNATGGTTVMCASCGRGIGDHDAAGDAASTAAAGGNHVATAAVVGEPVAAGAGAAENPIAGAPDAAGGDGALSVNVEPSELRFKAPRGQPVDCTVQVTNTSSGKYTLEALSRCWRYKVTPQRFTLGPEESTQVTVRLTSPDGALTSDRQDVLELRERRDNGGVLRGGQRLTSEITLTEVASLVIEPGALYFPAPQDRRAQNTVQVTNTTTSEAYRVSARCSVPGRYFVKPRIFTVGPGQSLPLTVCLYSPEAAAVTDSTFDIAGKPQRGFRRGDDADIDGKMIEMDGDIDGPPPPNDDGNGDGAAQAGGDDDEQSKRDGATVRLDYVSTRHSTTNTLAGAFGVHRQGSVRNSVSLRINSETEPPLAANFVHLGQAEDAPYGGGAPPPLPPGLVSDPKKAYDDLSLDQSGVSWKVMFIAHVMAIVVGVPCLLFGDFRTTRGIILMSLGITLLSLTWGLTLSVSGLPLLWFCMGPMNRIYTIHFEKPFTKDKPNGERVIWVENACCGNDREPHKVRDIGSVDVEYNAMTQEARVKLAGILVYRGTTADPEPIARAWRLYLEPNAPDRLDHTDVTVTSPVDIAEPPQLPPGVVPNAVDGCDDLTMDESGLVWKVSVAVIVVSTIAGSLMIYVSTLIGMDTGAGLGLIIAGGLLLGCVFTALFFLPLCITLHDMYTIRISDPASSSAADYGERTVWLDRCGKDCWSSLGYDDNYEVPFKVRAIDKVEMNHNPISKETHVRLVGSSTTGTFSHHNVLVFHGKTENPEAIAAAWRVYLKPEAPEQLKEDPPTIDE